jgi:hypothetical protein
MRSSDLRFLEGGAAQIPRRRKHKNTFQGKKNAVK